VVDDNADVLETLAAVLRLLHYEVEAVASGEDALRRMEDWRPDVAIVDVGMPRMSGYEVASLARLQPWGSQLRLVAMTGWGEPEDQQRALSAGFDRHVVKPVDLEHLRSLLDSMVATAQ
jgi:CheY-like chemotaxis protein